MIHKRSKVEFHPLGVIGAIVSWNYPFHNIFNPMLAAVFLGNNIVIKVSKNASWSGCFYIRIIQAALVAIGAPENLVDVVTGFVETGEAMVASVDKVIFVGSPGVGRMIMRNVAETLASVTLELGGKDPFIMCDDVDVPHVAQIVHSAVYSSFIKQVEKIVKSVSAVNKSHKELRLEDYQLSNHFQNNNEVQHQMEPDRLYSPSTSVITVEVLGHPLQFSKCLQWGFNISEIYIDAHTFGLKSVNSSRL